MAKNTVTSFQKYSPECGANRCALTTELAKDQSSDIIKAFTSKKHRDIYTAERTMAWLNQDPDLKPNILVHRCVQMDKQVEPGVYGDTTKMKKHRKTLHSIPSRSAGN